MSSPPKQGRWSRMGNAMKRAPSILAPSNASIKSQSSSPPPPATPPPTTVTPAAVKKNSTDRDSDTASITTSKEKSSIVKGSIRSRMGKAMKRTSSLLTPAAPRRSGSIDSMDTKIDTSSAVLSPPAAVSTAPLVSPIAESPVIVQPAFASFTTPNAMPEQAQAVTVSGTSDNLLPPPAGVSTTVPATIAMTDEPEAMTDEPEAMTDEPQAMSESDLSPPVQADTTAPETEEVQQIDPTETPAAPQMQIERSISASSYEVVSAPQEEVQLPSQELVQAVHEAEFQPTHHVDVPSAPQDEVVAEDSKEVETMPGAHEEEDENEPASTAEKVEPTVPDEVPVSSTVEEVPQPASHADQDVLPPTEAETDPSSLEATSTASPHQPPAVTEIEADLAEALADEHERLPSQPTTNGSASRHPIESGKPKLDIIHPLSQSHGHPLSISTANSTTTATTAITVAAGETDPLLPSIQVNGSASYPPGTKPPSVEGNNSTKRPSPESEKPLIDRFVEWLWSWIPWDTIIV